MEQHPNISGPSSLALDVHLLEVVAATPASVSRIHVNIIMV